MTVRLMEKADLAPYTWLRVGGPADKLYLPNTEEELAAVLRELSPVEKLTVLGVGSNVIVRDDGIEGTVVRLGPGFAKVSIDGTKVTAGAAALDAKVAKHAAKSGLSGLSFYAGIPGTIGGAMRMNAGAYGGETRDHFVSGRAINRKGDIVTLSADDFAFRYRWADVPSDLVLIEATYEAPRGDAAAEGAKIVEIMEKREATQPIREKTGGSTFKNPDPDLSGGRSAWQSVDAVGGRGRTVGDAMMSDLHANFMINKGNATAAELETLGESIRADVQKELGYELEWEIKRIGRLA